MLIVRRTVSQVNKKASKHLKEHILDTELQMLEDVGHGVNTQAPRQLAQVIRSFYKI